ncbi:MAG: acyl-CoA thioesterase [Endozoicomonadaceae bacterium]|nr:acyl-CoA thioesterase [Endozoicomonadaceae bacterium]MCY4330074.1 acyl-CoA thioesterase [Endozoicomonadaceae bacterium]
MPSGTLALRTVAMPKDTNPNGDIFGGWLISQMDLAASTCAKQACYCRVATVAMDSISFLQPVSVGDILCFYTELLSTGRSSMKIRIEAWKISLKRKDEQRIKVTEGVFTFVALDDAGKSKPVFSSETK